MTASPLRAEVQTISKMAVPLALTQLGLMLTTVVDTMMVGHLGTIPLAALALGNVWEWAFLVVCLGVLMGLDPLISQAHGRGDASGLRLALQRGLVLSGLLSIPAIGCLLLTEQVLLLVGQDAQLASLAQAYNVWKLPSLTAMLVFTVQRQFLQGQGVMAPATWAMAAANLFNIAANWALIWGHLGLPAMGLRGAGLATTLTSFVMVGTLHMLMRRLDLMPRGPRGLDRQALTPDGLRQILALGLPVGFHMGLEHLAFGGSAVLAGWIDVAAVGGHHVTLSLAALAFMVPLGISTGASARVGNLIGAQDQAGMRRAVRASLIVSCGSMALLAGSFLAFRRPLAAMYTDDQPLIATVAGILPIVAAFQLSDGLQVVAAGILRGMGRPRPGALVNLLSYYVIAFPLAYYLAFSLGWGLVGIWTALAVGVTLAAILLISWTFRVERAELSTLSHEVR